MRSGRATVRHGDPAEQVRLGHRTGWVGAERAGELWVREGGTEALDSSHTAEFRNTQLLAMPRCSCVEMYPGCCFIQLASCSHAASKASTSAATTVKTLTSTTGETEAPSCFSIGTMGSSGRSVSMVVSFVGWVSFAARVATINVEVSLLLGPGVAQPAADDTLSGNCRQSRPPGFREKFDGPF